MSSSKNSQLSGPRDVYWSVNYQGSRESRKNYSEDISDDENCSVWITYLPPRCDYATLCRALRGTGKIYSMFINPPTEPYITSAAKVVFWDRQGAERLTQMVKSEQFKVGRHRPRVVPHRIKVSEQRPSRRSRVIEIRGPSSIVNHDYLHAFFRERFQFDLEDVRVVGHLNGISTMRWSFRGYRCQSQFAVLYIFRQRDCNDKSPMENYLWSQVYVRWVEDPCS